MMCEMSKGKGRRDERKRREERGAESSDDDHVTSQIKWGLREMSQDDNGKEKNIGTKCRH